MSIGKPIGGSGFVSMPITTTEQAYHHCRPRGGERPDLRGTVAPTEAQVMAAANYESHATARSGAARAGIRRVISTEQALLARTAAVEARSVASGSAATQAHIERLEALLAAQQVLLDTQAAAIDAQRADIADLRSQVGNDAYIGDHT